MFEFSGLLLLLLITRIRVVVFETHKEFPAVSSKFSCCDQHVKYVHFPQLSVYENWEGTETNKIFSDFWYCYQHMWLTMYMFYCMVCTMFV